MLPLVALHGLASTSDEWDEFARSLPPAWEFIAFDQLAHGSAAEMTGDLSREAHVAHVVSQIRRHAATPCVLVGQSMGAHTAMLVAAHHPQLVSALVLIEGGVGGEGPEATTDVIAWVRTLVDDQGEPRFDAVALARAIVRAKMRHQVSVLHRTGRRSRGSDVETPCTTIRRLTADAGLYRGV